VQVDEELAAGEPPADPVRPVDGERRLPDARAAAEREHRDRVRLGRRGRQQRVEPRDLGVATGESVDVQRKLDRHGERLGAAVAVAVAVVVQDGHVHPAQLRTRFHAEHVDQPLPGGAVAVEGLRRPSLPQQRLHQHRRERLHQRMLAEHLPQRANRLAGAAEAELDPGPQHVGVQPLLVEHRPGSRRPFAGQVGERLAVPQRTRLGQHRGPLFVVVAAVAGRVDQPAEPVQVDILAVERQPVSAGHVHQLQRCSGAVDRVPQHATQAGDVAVEGAAYRCGWIVAPDPINQHFGGHGLVGVDEQGGKNRALLRRSQIHGPTGDPQRNRSEQLQLSHDPSTPRSQDGARSLPSPRPKPGFGSLGCPAGRGNPPPQLRWALRRPR
jgi:hypothetical protein